jgi:hypothetical protein
MTQIPQRSENSRRESRLRLSCPHCDAYARVRTTYKLTKTYREMRIECTNDACGFVWLIGMEALRTLCPSDQPKPEIDIPLATDRSVASSTTAAPIAAAG